MNPRVNLLSCLLAAAVLALMEEGEADADDLWEAAGFIRTPEETDADAVDAAELRSQLTLLSLPMDALAVGTGSSWDGSSAFYEALCDDWEARLATDTFSPSDDTAILHRSYADTECDELLIAFASCTKARFVPLAPGSTPSFEYIGACERLGVKHALFVRDPLQAWFLRPDGGDGFSAVLAMLSREVASLAPHRVLTIGSSMGGFAALRAAAALGAAHADIATSAIAFGPQIFLDPLEREALRLPSTEFDRELAALKKAGVPLMSLVDVLAREPGGTSFEIHVGKVATGDVREARLLQYSLLGAEHEHEHAQEHERAGGDSSQGAARIAVTCHRGCAHCVAAHLGRESLDPLLLSWLQRQRHRWAHATSTAPRLEL
jgi:pimeloyl-ACP methyl ester carboxylesterase